MKAGGGQELVRMMTQIQLSSHFCFVFVQIIYLWSRIQGVINDHSSLESLYNPKGYQNLKVLSYPPRVKAILLERPGVLDFFFLFGVGEQGGHG